MATDYQIQYRGVTMGDSTNYDLINVIGTDDLLVRIGDRDMPRMHGQVGGVHLASYRIIDVELEVRGAPGSTALMNDYQALLSALSPDGQVLPDDTNDVFTWKWAGQSEQFVRARPIRRAAPRRNDTEFGLLPITFQLRAADPRKYSTVFNSDLNNTGTFNVTNGGAARAYPKLTFLLQSGTQCKLTNNTTGQVEDIQGLTSGTTQLYVLDNDVYIRGVNGLVAYQVTGSVNRYGDWQLPRTPMYLAPGVNSLTLNNGTNVDVEWYDTWM